MGTVLVYDAYDEVGVNESVDFDANPTPSVLDSVAIAEVVGIAPDKQVNVAEVVSLAEYRNIAGSRNPSVYDEVAVDGTNVTIGRVMAVLHGMNVVTLQAFGDNNWTWLDSFPGNRPGIKVLGIVIMAAGADTFILREGSVTGPIWFKNVATGAEVKYVPISLTGLMLRPVLKMSEQTLDAGSMYSILYERV